MTEYEAQLIAQAELGEEATKFMDGDLFRFMVGCAEQDSQDAIEALKTVSPRDAEAIAVLQNKAKFGECFREYLRELVDKGNAALVQWKESRSDGTLE